MSDNNVNNAFTTHDHRRCIKGALNEARRICLESNGRLTRQRKRALELVWQSHRPIGAYEILEQLRAEGFNGAPPTVYRALDFLLAHGLIHRIESLNAYTGCAIPGQRHTGQFLICSQCQRVAELDDPKVTRAISTTAARLGFVAANPVVEIRGLCQACRDHQSGVDGG
jgi:Fur family zinc uptake transcriptional regulator